MQHTMAGGADLDGLRAAYARHELVRTPLGHGSTTSAPAATKDNK